MKIYSSCFIGIALPEKHQEEFEKLLADIKIIDANIETVQSKTPHITVFYLNQQSQYSLNEITNLIKQKVNMLHNTSLTVGGFDYFTKDTPRVLFLNVIYPTILATFNTILTELLPEYGDIDNAHSFHPHITVGRIISSLAKESFDKNKEELQVRLDKITWHFPCREITLYGVDSSQSPQYQEKLAVIPIS